MSWHEMGCSCCADNWTDEGILGNEDLSQFIVRCPSYYHQHHEPYRLAALNLLPRTQDVASVTCLNESSDGAARAVVSAKGWCNRLNEDSFLESDAVRTAALPEIARAHHAALS
jgi:hypothetical protein